MQKITSNHRERKGLNPKGTPGWKPGSEPMIASFHEREHSEVRPEAHKPFDERDESGPTKARGLSLLEAIGAFALLTAPIWGSEAYSAYKEHTDPVIVRAIYEAKAIKAENERFYRLHPELIGGRK